MIRFAEWLGESNGKDMLCELLAQYETTQDQAVACVTTYCLMFDIKVDTKKWDELIDYLYKHYNSWYDTKEEMDGDMCRFLI